MGPAVGLKLIAMLLRGWGLVYHTLGFIQVHIIVIVDMGSCGEIVDNENNNRTCCPYVCMCVCVCICTYVHVHVPVYVCVCTCVYIRLFACLCVYVCVCVCVFACI